jgi:hypothetical protein
MYKKVKKVKMHKSMLRAHVHRNVNATTNIV